MQCSTAGVLYYLVCATLPVGTACASFGFWRIFLVFLYYCWGWQRWGQGCNVAARYAHNGEPTDTPQII
jgi:hypothetical protein